MAIRLISPRSLPPNASIREAFEAIAGTFGMVITIVREGKNMLVGVVTDGDLKKALLNGKSINTKLSEIMNKDPVVISIENLDKPIRIQQLREKLRQRGVEPEYDGDRFAIPVVDEYNNVEGLTTLGILNSLEPISEERKYDPAHTTLGGKPQVLVVGGGGYIGSVLIEKLLDKGWSVKVLDYFIYSRDAVEQFSSRANFTVLDGDVCNLNTQVEAIDQVDCVVFLAEIVGDPSCHFLPEMALKTNYLAVNSMATLCSHLHINRFIYTSSCSVYGAGTNSSTLLDERSPLNPISHYARMKIASEEALFSQSNPLFAPTILRLGTVFGWSHRPRFDLVVNTFARDAFMNKSLKVFGGNQWRPNVHVGDVAESIVKVIEAPMDKVARQVFNVGSNLTNHTIEELAELTANVFSDCAVIIDDRNIDVRNYRVDFGKLKHFIGYEPKTSVRDGLLELKHALESEGIADLNSKAYSNIETLKARLNTAS